MPEQTIDLFDHRQTQNLWEITREWRRDSPVARPYPGYAYVSRWYDCWDVLRDSVTFANGNGFKAVEMPDDERMLGEMDAPRHPKLRRIVRASFTRRTVKAERPFARESAERLLAEIAGQPEADLVAEFTDQITNRVSFHVLGFPLEDTPQIVAWAREILHSEWPALNRTERGEGLAGAFPEFVGYVDELVESRRGLDAPDDLISRLASSEFEGRPFSATVMRSLTAQIILGGISTSTNLLGSMLHRLLRDRELHAGLRAEPELVPAAVEESLRLDPPVLFVVRQCTVDAKIAGEKIGAGEKVAVGIASANRDEAVFDEPDRYRLDRGLPRHISFSGGAHFCMGAGLARMVACEVISAFVRRFDVGEIALAPGFVFEGVPVFLEYGPVRLDVRIASHPSSAG
ncbi:MAG: cytochrome P450 [Deltaproteobacteria bacterium]|nr:cytochrome P450 [Deltaproteobacteria bacterium]